MVKVDTIEGTIDGGIWYHYDLASDVLYLRLVNERETATYAEETQDGLLLLRREDNDSPAGLTVINWWKRFGQGSLPDSIRQLETAIEPWASRLAA